MQLDNKDEAKFPESQNPKIESESFPPDFENPGSFPCSETKRIKREGLPGLWYLNPIARVMSPQDSEEFMRVVTKRQAEWFRHLTRQFKNGWREVRNQQSSRLQQAFEFDGIIISDGIILPIMDWKRFRVNKNKPRAEIPNHDD